MNCYCCQKEISLARKAKLRIFTDFDPTVALPDTPAYQSYLEEMTFRWAIVCLECYRTIDNVMGLAFISGKPFNLAGASRGDKAAVIDEVKYQVWQRREAAKLGLDLD